MLHFLQNYFYLKQCIADVSSVNIGRVSSTKQLIIAFFD